MTPLEDRLRRAIRDKAGEVPSDAVPPLRLPARRRRSFSLTYWGGGRTGAAARWGWRGWLVPAAAAVLVVAVVVGSEALSRALYGRPVPARAQQAAVTVRDEAAAWVAAQVSRSAVVSCDPVMCQALEKHGIPARGLHELKPGAPAPLHSDVIVATAAIRAEFGAGLTSVYAPGVIASFGSGSTRIDIRVIARKGGAAYRSALSADLAARKKAGPQLLRIGGISAPGHGPKATRSWPGRFPAPAHPRRTSVPVAGFRRDLWRPAPRCQPRHPAPERLPGTDQRQG